MTFGKVYREFKDHTGARVCWYWRDRFNTHGKHTLHPEYDEAGFDDTIQTCLSKATMICLDKDNPNRKCFYLDQSHLGDPNRKFLKIVVDYNTLGFLSPTIITSHYVNEVSPRDTKLWP